MDLAASIVAQRQHGVVLREQLVAIGMSEKAIEYRLANGRLHRLHRGVYLFGNPLPAPFALDLAAVMACGEATYLGGRSAVAAYGMSRPHDGPRQVTVVGRRPRQPGILTHTVATLDPRDHRLWHGIPIVSPARAIIEFAADATANELADAVERGQVDRLLTRQSLQQTLDRAPRRPGTRLVRALLTDLTFTRSKAERIVLGLIKQAKLPTPRVNHPVDGDEIDFVWEELLLTLEVDSFKFHATRAAFERDRRRDADRQRAGHVVIRATYQEITTRPYYFVARVAAAVARAQDRLNDRRLNAAVA